MTHTSNFIVHVHAEGVRAMVMESEFNVARHGLRIRDDSIA